MKTSFARRIAAGGIAAMMTIGMSVTGLAETTDVSAASGKYVAVKNLYAATGVTVKDTTFSFTVAPASDAQIAAANRNDGSEGAYTVAAGSALGENGTDRTVTAAVTSAKTLDVATGDLFTAADFPHDSVAPGVYGYQVSETQSGYTGTGKMTYDSTVYYVEVKVTYDSEAKANVISEVTAQKVTAAGDGTITLGDKVSSISFNNKYTVYGNEDPDDPENPSGDPDTSADHSLVITKKVEGNGAENGKKFRFTITFTEDTAMFGDSGDADAQKVNDGLELLADQDLAAAADGESSTIAAKTPLSYDTAYTFELGDGDSVNFKVPAGTQYAVSEDETSAAGYTQTVAQVTDGASQAAANLEDARIGSKSNSVTFTNTKNINPLTGIVNNYGALIAVVAVAAAGIVALIFRRRRGNA